MNELGWLILSKVGAFTACATAILTMTGGLPVIVIAAGVALWAHSWTKVMCT